MPSLIAVKYFCIQLRTVPCGTLVTSLKMINELNLTRDAVPDIELDEVGGYDS